MPNRLIREGWLDSAALSRLPAEAERFFLRLFLVADDAGRFDGRPLILKNRCFPVLIGINEKQIMSWVSACVQAHLVVRYEWEGKPYLQISKFQRSSPAAYSKYPWMDGSHKIVYARREVRDGQKEFVLTSLADPLPMGSVRDTDGIGKGSVRDRHGIGGLAHESPETETETETETIAEPGQIPAGGSAETPPGDLGLESGVEGNNQDQRQPGEVDILGGDGGGVATLPPPTQAKAVSVRLEAKPLTPIQTVVLGFKFRMGVPDEDRAWDRVYFSRFSAPAKGLLLLFDGDIGAALDCLDAVANAHKLKGLSWTPETILKHAGDYKHGRLFK